MSLIPLKDALTPPLQPTSFNYSQSNNKTLLKTTIKAGLRIDDTVYRSLYTALEGSMDSARLLGS